MGKKHWLSAILGKMTLNPKGLTRPDKIIFNPFFKKPGLNFMYRVYAKTASWVGVIFQERFSDRIQPCTVKAVSDCRVSKDALPMFESDEVKVSCPVEGAWGW